MAARDVGTACNLVFQLVAKIQQLGNDWYKVSDDWKDLPRKVDLLRQKCDFLTAKISQFGLSKDNLMKTLETARSLLAEEEDKLTKRQAKHGSGLVSKAHRVAFSAQIGLSIQRVINAFNAILEISKFQEDVHDALIKKLLRGPASLGIREDVYNRYVHLEVSESEVRSTLEDPAGPTVGLLHGGAGRGKSTLARHIALYYDRTDHFDRVVWLCGREDEALSIQRKLLTRLGVDTTSLPDEQRNSNVSISKLLEGVLKDQKILIIFDDMWDGDLLQAMVNLCGKGVKFLVTSQNGSLCDDLNFSFSAIKIQVSEEDARKVLASHVGFPNQLIPEKLKGLIDGLVRKCDGNLLAVALIAKRIDRNRSDELETWEDASSNFFQALHPKCTTHVLGRGYSESFITAMQWSMQPLSKNAKTLLVLTHCCEGPSVPEEVVSVLYKYLEGSTTFHSARIELESRELLKIDTVDLSKTQPFWERPHRSWSIHSLQHLFIDYEMKYHRETILQKLAALIESKLMRKPPPDEDCIESMLMRLAALIESKIRGETPPDEDKMVLVGLCALYLHSRFAESVASKMCIPVERFAKSRRVAIEPITRLLGQPISDRWTAAALSATRQVSSMAESLQSAADVLNLIEFLYVRGQNLITCLF